MQIAQLIENKALSKMCQMTTKRETTLKHWGLSMKPWQLWRTLAAISKITMREFDAACLQPVQELQPEAIHALREQASTFPNRFLRPPEYLQESCL